MKNICSVSARNNRSGHPAQELTIVHDGSSPHVPTPIALTRIHGVEPRMMALLHHHICNGRPVTSLHLAAGFPNPRDFMVDDNLELAIRDAIPVDEDPFWLLRNVKQLNERAKRDDIDRVKETYVSAALIELLEQLLCHWRDVFDVVLTLQTRRGALDAGHRSEVRAEVVKRPCEGSSY